jgi:transporter family protein
MRLFSQWQFWAAGSAFFAALTAILGKIGVESVNSHFATLIRTVVILFFVLGVVVATAAYQPLATVTRKTYLFLVLSGAATAASWLCYYRALKEGPASGVAPLDKISVVMVAIMGVFILREKLPVLSWIGIGMIAIGSAIVAITA